MIHKIIQKRKMSKFECKKTYVPNYKNPYIINISKGKNIIFELEKAKRLQENAGDYDAIEIKIESGLYELDRTILIDEKIAFGLPLIFIGENNVVFSGGKSFKGGWKLVDKEKNIYKKDIYINDFRQLYVDGKRANRARFPKNNEYLKLFWQGERDAKDEDRFLGFRKSELPNNMPEDANGVELHFEQSWATSVAIITGKKVEDEIVYYHVNNEVSEPLWTRTYLPRVSDTQPAWLENSYNFLTDENEWFNNGDELFYIPPKGVDINELTFTFPRLENILKIAGNENQSAKNIYFKNISFSYSNWNKISYGYCEMQATNYVKGAKALKWYQPESAIESYYTNNIVFEDCKINNIGATAFRGRKRLNGIVFNRLEIKNIMGTGLTFGYVEEQQITDFDPFYGLEDGENCTQNITIVNSSFSKIGLELLGGSAICSGYIKNINIVHNLIHDISYSGIALGWGWQKPQKLMGNFKILNNRIYDTMNTLAFDGSEIYFVGKHDEDIPISTIEENYITCGGGFGGVYFDEGSTFFKMTNNVIEGLGNYPGKKLTMFFHDVNCLEKNIEIKNTFTEHANAFDPDTTIGGMLITTYMTTESEITSAPIERNILVDDFIVKDGEWSAPAKKIIDNAGILK